MRHGTRAVIERESARSDWPSEVTEDLARFLAERDSFYLATVSETGHPYIQHRGGPKGFLKVLDARTLGFADFSGNRQYITAGNLDGNDRVHLFLMDYANRQRIKLWGRARIVDDDPTLVARLVTPGARGRVERAILIRVEAWSANCPSHIPELYGTEAIREATARLTTRIAELEAECAELRRWLGTR